MDNSISISQKLLDKDTEKIIGKVTEFTSGYYKHYMLDLDGLCEKLGIGLYEAKFEDENVSGAITKSGDSWQIVVNELHAPTRRRFTVAHELGHYFAIVNNSLPAVEYLEDNNNVIKDYFILNRSDNVVDDVYQVERQANYIGASILMPENMVKPLFEQNTNPLEMAQKFGVSEAALSYRLKSLGLLTSETLE